MGTRINCSSLQPRGSQSYGPFPASRTLLVPRHGSLPSLFYLFQPCVLESPCCGKFCFLSYLPLCFQALLLPCLWLASGATQISPLMSSRIGPLSPCPQKIAQGSLYPLCSLSIHFIRCPRPILQINPNSAMLERDYPEHSAHTEGGEGCPGVGR